LTKQLFLIKTSEIFFKKIVAFSKELNFTNESVHLTQSFFQKKFEKWALLTPPDKAGHQT